jgi:hypothetical protein
MAVAHGNRTHRGRLSAPATGFEDRASHQIRKRYRVVLTLKLGQADKILSVWCRAGAASHCTPAGVRRAHLLLSTYASGAWLSLHARLRAARNIAADPV